MSLAAYTAKTWTDYADSPDLSAANVQYMDSGIAAVTAEVLSLEAALPSTYQPISAELSALAGLSSTGYAKRTGAGAWSVVASIPQADVSGLTAALATIPLASATTPLMNGTAAVGTGTTWARADHVHPSDTSKLGVRAQAYDSARLGGVVAASYALASSVPVASSTTPSALGTAAVGIGTTWARADHVHAMPTAAQVGAEPALGNPGTSGFVLSSTTGGVRSWVALPSVPVSSVFGRTGAVAAASGDYSTFYQPLNSNLTSIAALTTTAFGRSLLTVADAAAARTAIGAASAASLGDYLPRAGGTLTGSLNGTTTTMGVAKIGTSTSNAGYAEFSHSSLFGTNSYALLQDSIGNTIINAASGKLIYFNIYNGDAILTVGASVITAHQQIDGTRATFSAEVVASSFRSSAWTADTSYLVLNSPTSYWAGIVVSGSGNQQTQTFAQVDINGSLQRRADIAANAANFGGLVYGGAYDASTYTTPGFAGNWASTGHWGIIGDNTSTLRFRVLDGANADAGSFANIAVGNVTGTSATFSSRCTQSSYTIWDAGNLTWAGSGGSYGSATTMARSDHNHSGTYVDRYNDQDINGGKTFKDSVYFGSLYKMRALASNEDRSVTFSFNSNPVATFYKDDLSSWFYRLKADNVKSHLVPLGTGTYDLGSSAYYWRNIFSTYATIDFPIFQRTKYDIYSTPLDGGTDYATAVSVARTYHLTSGQVANKWFKFPSASLSLGQEITIVVAAQSEGVRLVSVSGYFRYKDGSISSYNNANPPKTPSSTWISNGADWIQVG